MWVYNMNTTQIIDKLGLLSSILANPFYYIIQYHFLKKFLGFKCKSWKFIFMAVTFILLNCLFFEVDSPLILIERTLLWFAFLCYLCHGNFILKLYAAILPSTISLLTYITFLELNYNVSSYISNFKISSAKDIFLIFLINLAMEFVTLAIFFVILKKICDFINFKGKIINLYRSLYLLFPCLTTFSLVLIFYYIQAIYVEGKNYYLFTIFPEIYSIVPLVSISLLLSLLVNAYIFKKVLQGDEIEQKNLLMEQQFKLQINHNKNVESLYTDIRSIKHDMTNHLICLKNLSKQGNLEEIINYLHTLGQRLAKLDNTINTGNPVSDAIINEKYNIAKLEGIEFSCNFILPDNFQINPVDLCIILSNALDNAIEACIKIKDKTISRKISITSYLRDLYFIIEISNSTINKIQYNNNIIVSQKEDKNNHGIGISNIEMVVKKYDGILDIMVEKNTFILNLMLKLKDNQ
jgi:sensor histidine kinase YesM